MINSLSTKDKKYKKFLGGNPLAIVRRISKQYLFIAAPTVQEFFFQNFFMIKDSCQIEEESKDEEERT